MNYLIYVVCLYIWIFICTIYNMGVVENETRAAAQVIGVWCKWWQVKSNFEWAERWKPDKRRVELRVGKIPVDRPGVRVRRVPRTDCSRTRPEPGRLLDGKSFLLVIGRITFAGEMIKWRSSKVERWRRLAGVEVYSGAICVFRPSDERRRDW